MSSSIHDHLLSFSLNAAGSLFPAGERSQQTRLEHIEIGGGAVAVYINEYWTARQRQASSIHEISYRACFKPQLPRFFINLLSTAGDLVYDPFAGRGTTAVEAGLLGRRVISSDINPLSAIMARPRFFLPDPARVEQRLRAIEQRPARRAEIDLSMFFHPETEAEIVSLKEHLAGRRASGCEDSVDRWIRMVATNRLTGHSPGFFSVYTLPPNQAVSPERQLKINRKLKQKPPCRDTCRIILKKTWSLLRNLTAVQRRNLDLAAETALFLEEDARATAAIASETVRLTVTSPPFLDVVHYAGDNWLRCWFNEIDEQAVAGRLTVTRCPEEWSAAMAAVFRELYRITVRGGWVAFEVGEIRHGSLNLEELVVPLGEAAGFSCRGILLNLQRFTKTANIWGVENNRRGTNSNRVVLFEK